VRSGLASHTVPRAVLSGAAMGHDQVRDGAGWSHGALGHAHTPGALSTLDRAIHSPSQLSPAWRRECREVRRRGYMSKDPDVENRPRPLVRLGSSQLPAVHRPPINPVVFRGSYALKEPRRLILRRASHLDAVSGYPCRTWLPSGARCRTTGTPAVRPARSSRTRASSAQPSKRPRRIETELSHDVLNPARVPL
jgi:hypothetical protein